MGLLGNAIEGVEVQTVGLRKVRWTGYPFVDAGLAAIAAAAQVQELEDITVDKLQSAVDELLRILLSDQSLGIGVERSFARGALSQVFPNSELVNPSNWKKDVKRKFEDAVRSDLARARIALQAGGEGVCSLCGRRCPPDAIVSVRKDKTPLLEGIVNFYPAFDYGVTICGICALALRFLPFSLLKVGGSNRLWFLHTQQTPLAVSIAKQYGWTHFNNSIAQNSALDFYSSWQTAGEAGTVLYLLCEMLTLMSNQPRQNYQHPLPTTAYIFSNDNRGGYLSALPIPSEIMIFLAKLQVVSHSAFQRFWKELLQVAGNGKDKSTQSVRSVADRILHGKAIVSSCLDNETPKLRGGWLAHRLYLEEVRKMPTGKLSILEQLGTKIAQSEDFNKRVMDLRKAESHELYAVLLRYVREGWLRHDEFYTLLPPNDDTSVSEVRDILLAVVYEWQYCQESGEQFHALSEAGQLTPDETLQRIQRIGERLRSRLPNLSRWIGRLQTAKRSDHIRAAYLRAVQSGAIGFDDFIFLAPLGEPTKLWLLRDYLLAFLFERAREILPEEEEEISVGTEVLAGTFEGGEE